MKKLLFILSAVLVFASCNNMNSNRQKEVEDSLRNELNLKDKEMDEMLEALNIVQDGFRQIDEAAGRIDLSTSNENLMSEKEKIEDQMKFIQSKMAENEAQIEKMQKLLNSSNAANAKFKKIVADLQQQLAQKEQYLIELQKELDAKNIHIAALDSTITNMNTKLTDLQAENENKTKVVDAQDKMINRAWYVFGTKKELKNHKIIDDGEVLKNTEFDQEYFTEVDIREFKELPLYSKKVTIETAHPEGTYQLVKDEKGQYVLKITKPEEFWNVSRYLVILVK